MPNLGRPTNRQNPPGFNRRVGKAEFSQLYGSS